MLRAYVRIGSRLAVHVILLGVGGCADSHGRARDASAHLDAASLTDGPAERDADASSEVCVAATTASEALEFFDTVRRALCVLDRWCPGETTWSLEEDCFTYGSPALALLFVPPFEHLADYAFDPREAGRCLDSLSCDEREQWRGRPWEVGEWPNGEPCWRVFRPRCSVSTATACLTSYDCAVDQFCDFAGAYAEGWTGSCRRQCHAARGLGEPCSYTYECAARDPTSDLRLCRFRDGRSVCVQARVSDEAREGDSCGEMGADADGTVVLRPCMDGFACASASGVEQCQPITTRGEGEPCAGFLREQCDQGLHCDLESRTCRSPRVLSPHAIGDPCVPGDTCDVQSGSRCVDGVCIQAGREVSDPCDILPPFPGAVSVRYCIPPLVCDSAADRCLGEIDPVSRICAVDE